MQLEICYNHKIMTVDRDIYAKAKLKQLREFGYPNLTLKEVQDQIDAVLTGKEFGAGLTVVGIFMQDEVKREAKARNGTPKA